MEFNTFAYLCRMGFKNMRRNRVYLAASVITMSICIFLFGIFFLAMANVENMLKTAENEMAVLVFFDEDISQKQIEEIGNQIRQRQEVIKTTYVSADEAWESFQNKVIDGQNQEAEVEETEQNPLAHSDNYQVYIRGIEHQKAFVDYIKTVDGVRKATHSEAAVEVLTIINKVISAATMLCMVILVLISVFLINNTLAVGMEARKEKIKVMLLMGAKNSFVKVPYIVEGLVIGILGSGIPLFFLLLTYRWGIERITGKLDILKKGVQFLPAGAVFPQLAIIAVLLGISVGFFGSLITIRRHLKL